MSDKKHYHWSDPEISWMIFKDGPQFFETEEFQNYFDSWVCAMYGERFWENPKFDYDQLSAYRAAMIKGIIFAYHKLQERDGL